MADLYPTPTRLKLVDAIERGEVHGYPSWKKPRVWLQNGGEVTDRIAEFAREGLATYADPEPDAGPHSPRRVDLTDAGRAWRDAARADA